MNEWLSLLWAEFVIAEFVMGRVCYGPICPGTLHDYRACVHGSTNGTNGIPISFKVLHW